MFGLVIFKITFLLFIVDNWLLLVECVGYKTMPFNYSKK